MSSNQLALAHGIFKVQTTWTPAQLAATWVSLQAQITPFNNVLTLDGALYRALDFGAKCFIAETLAEQTQEMAMYCRDGTGYDRYFLSSPRHFLEDNGVIVDVAGREPFWFAYSDNLQMTWTPNNNAILTPSKSKDVKIPRPPNGFILYRKERHSIVKETHPGITNNEICKYHPPKMSTSANKIAAKVLGNAWNNESREVRRKYKGMADDIKRAHLEAHPKYTYKPRKPSEKKKRARRSTQTHQVQTHDGDQDFDGPSPANSAAASN